MSKQRDDGGPAFPVDPTNDPGLSLVGQFVSPGMSVRDLFAGMAISGMLANPDITSGPRLAKIAYEMADEMLKARNQ